uniref:Putative secreted protein n=1 Tax=Rhipicephalus microplus TaxID=6941 RepID=A0A6M2DCN1_RHIMP
MSGNIALWCSISLLEQFGAIGATLPSLQCACNYHVQKEQCTNYYTSVAPFTSLSFNISNYNYLTRVFAIKNNINMRESDYGLCDLQNGIHVYFIDICPVSTVSAVLAYDAHKAYK